MGFAKLFEDICDRYFESDNLSEIWAAYQGPKSPTTFSPSAAVFDRPRRLIHDFWTFYQQEPAASLAPSEWEQHHRNLERLSAILRPVEHIDEATPDGWEAVNDVDKNLRSYFSATPYYGPLSRQMLDRIVADSKTIRSRIGAITKELNAFIAAAKATEAAAHAEVREAQAKFNEVRSRVVQDLDECKRYDQLSKEVQRLAQHFLRLYKFFVARVRSRPSLQHLHRLRLNDDQEGHVARDHTGPYRIQGASGSGKTVILLHRAIRLALEHPDKIVRVFTINRSLAELLQSGIAAIHGSVLPNLHVQAMYDFLIRCLALFDDCEQYRLVDDRSGERIAHSWHDFFHHRGKCPTRNVFADPANRDLIRYFSDHGKLNVDACRYIRDEIVYIQSGYGSSGRWTYTNPQAEPRRQRSIGLNRTQRANCLVVLEAWEEWLKTGKLCDVEGLSLRAADYFDDEESRRRIREALPTDFILADEVQDFSTLELRLLRQLVTDSAGRNSIFLVGDLNQKVFAKHHRTGQAGYNFRGNADLLKQNFRNTRQILQAAYCLPQMFRPPDEEGLDLRDPELSPFEGRPPVALACSAEDHVVTILDQLRCRRGHRMAVVSENVELLAAVRDKISKWGLRCHELFRVEDMDQWRPQEQNVLEADLVLSRMEAVKGFEFDTVIVADLSDGKVPRPGMPEEEYWREAAIVYAALTRARDELILTYVEQPSLFLKVMSSHLEGPTESNAKLRDMLNSIEPSLTAKISPQE